MQEYLVRSGNETHTIVADEVCWGCHCLKFSRGKETVALFLEYSWFYRSDVEEFPESEEK